MDAAPNTNVRPADFMYLQLGLPFPLLASAYARWQDEKTFRTIFHQCPDLTLEQFLDWNYQSTVEPVGVCVGPHLAGIGWICQAYRLDRGIVAEVGAAFFKEVPFTIWRKGLNMLIRHGFVDRGFAEMYGISAKRSRSAGAITRRGGWRIVSHLPWAQEVNPGSTDIYCLRREEWEKRRSMTYQDLRAFGHVSDLSKALVNKGPSSEIDTAKGITQKQLDVASGAGARASEDYSTFKNLLQPIIDQQMKLATGDRSAALSAAMPVISKLSAGWQGAKDSIMSSMPAGAARDTAVAGLNRDMFTNIGGAQAQMVQQAPGTLAGVGNAFGNISLQEMGAQLAALSGGATTNYQAGQMDVQKQKAMLDFFGGLVNSATSLINPISLFSKAAPSSGGSGLSPVSNWGGNSSYPG